MNAQHTPKTVMSTLAALWITMIFAGSLGCSTTEKSPPVAAPAALSAADYEQSARDLARAGDSDASLEAFRAALSMEPDRVTALGGMGSLLVDLGRAEEAVLLLNEAITRGVAHEQLHHELGIAHETLGNAAEALDAYTAALELNSEHSPSIANVGNILFDLQAYDKAEAFYREALTHAPGDPDILRNLANLLLVTDRPVEAPEQFRAAIAAAPERAAPHLGLALAALATGDTETAEGALRETLRLDPSRIDARIRLIRIYEDRGAYAAGHEQLIALAKAAPMNAEAARLLGLSHLRREELVSALRHLDAAVSLDPESSEIHRDRAFALLLLGRAAEALPAYHEALRLNPNDPMVHYQMGWCHVRLGDLGSARACLDTLAPMDPDLAEDLRRKIQQAIPTSEPVLG